MHIHKSSKLHQQLKVIIYVILVLSLLTFFYFNYNVLSCVPIVQAHFLPQLHSVSYLSSRRQSLQTIKALTL